MRDGQPSRTAQGVAASRQQFERLLTPFGDPAADERLATDVAGPLTLDGNQDMMRYLRARTAFFDRVVVNALGRNVSQVVSVAAGYDGRALRYARGWPCIWSAPCCARCSPACGRWRRWARGWR